MKRLLSITLFLLLLAGCQGTAPNTSASGTTSAAAEKKAVILATTTSTRDSGLLDFLLPKFKESSGIEVKVVALGTGAAIEAAKAGNADVLMVHDRAKEDQFIAEGYGVERHDLMYNDFLLAGPDDKKDALGNAKDIVSLLQTIEKNRLPFVSRGDESGTHSFEKRIWKAAGVTLPQGTSDWYFSLGQGMSETLNVTSEKKGFTITDRSTFLATQKNTGLVEVSEPSKESANQYGVIELNPNKVTVRNPDGAKEFIRWILSEEAKGLISRYGQEEFGQQLFFPGTFK